MHILFNMIEHIHHLQTLKQDILFVKQYAPGLQKKNSKKFLESNHRYFTLALIDRVSVVEYACKIKISISERYNV